MDAKLKDLLGKPFFFMCVFLTMTGDRILPRFFGGGGLGGAMDQKKDVSTKTILCAVAKHRPNMRNFLKEKVCKLLLRLLSIYFFNYSLWIFVKYEIFYTFNCCGENSFNLFFISWGYLA